MFKLRTGYFVSGIVTGLILLFTFLTTLPDGKLHVFFCSVGQGDGTYIKLPDGRDMVVDGGPDNKILDCLSRHMPFWDRHINLVLMSHPQKDHFQGLIEVMRRYNVDYFLRSDVVNATQGYGQLMGVVGEKHISVKYLTGGERIDVGPTTLSVIWPSREQIAKGNRESLSSARPPLAASQGVALQESAVLGMQSDGELNDFSVVFWLRYGSFDALFPGDADIHVENEYIGEKLADNQVEVLKVPHHGSKTGMNKAFVDWLKPKLAVISVGKNSYGHPSEEAIDMLRKEDGKIMRTDKDGDVEVVSDGVSWFVNK